MTPRILLFTQPGCLSCEIMEFFSRPRVFPFEERDMEIDSAARLEFLEVYHSQTAPTLVILAASGSEVIEGFDPDRLDLLLSAA